MKRMLLIGLIFAAGIMLHAQSIQLPGVGSNQLTWANNQVNASTQLAFGNPEYQVTGFTLSFPTNTNPMFTGVSTTNHFTADMLTHLTELTAGSNIDLTVTLKAPGEGHESWQKHYTVQLTN
jgi:hypothetical protein